MKKNHICFQEIKKKKKKGFLMKEKSDLFLRTKRIGFLMNQKSDMFCDI